MRKPTAEELQSAAGKTLDDVLRRDLDVVFSGINPGLYTAAVGCHFARPGNRFWPTLHRAGFTPRQFSPDEQRGLLDLGIGMTNVVARATNAADELTPAELADGARTLEAKIKRYRPRVLAILGIGAYRTGFARPKARMGLQDETIAATRIWGPPQSQRPQRQLQAGRPGGAVPRAEGVAGQDCMNDKEVTRQSQRFDRTQHPPRLRVSNLTCPRTGSP